MKLGPIFFSFLQFLFTLYFWTIIFRFYFLPIYVHSLQFVIEFRWAVWHCTLCSITSFWAVTHGCCAKVSTCIRSLCRHLFQSNDSSVGWWDSGGQYRQLWYSFMDWREVFTAALPTTNSKYIWLVHSFPFSRFVFHFEDKNELRLNFAARITWTTSTSVIIIRDTFRPHFLTMLKNTFATELL